MRNENKSDEDENKELEAYEYTAMVEYLCLRRSMPPKTSSLSSLPVLLIHCSPPARRYPIPNRVIWPSLLTISIITAIY